MSVIPNDPLDNKNFILYDMNVIFNGPLEKKIVSYIIWITIIFNDPLDSRVPSLWDPLLDELRWSLCNNNRNQVHKERNVLESFWNHPPPTPPPVCGNSLPRNWSLVPKRLGTAALDAFCPSCDNQRYLQTLPDVPVSTALACECCEDRDLSSVYSPPSLQDLASRDIYYVENFCNCWKNSLGWGYLPRRLAG